MENLSCFPSTKTIVYSFQSGLRFLLRNVREFGGKEEDSRRPTNTKLLEHNLVKNFEVSIVYINTYETLGILDIF